MMNLFSVRVVARTDQPDSQGNVHLALQAFVNQKKIVLSLSTKVPLTSWDDKQQRVFYRKDCNFPKTYFKEINDLIYKSLSQATAIRHHYDMSDAYLTAALFRREFREDARKFGLITFFEKELLHLPNVMKASSIKNVKMSVRKLKDFRPDMRFGDLDLKLVQEFNGYLKKLGLSESTMSKHHKDFKMLINVTINRGLKIANPYEHFKIKVIKGNRDYLTPDELTSLKQLYESGTLCTEYARVVRCFLFSSYTGLRISDIRKITANEIMDDQLVFVPQKTDQIQKIVRVPLCDYAKKLIGPSPNGKLFEVYVDQVMNRYLKEIAVLANIPKRLSYHASRHSFAIQFLRAGGKVEVLMHIMGHSKIETTMEYVHVQNSDAREQIKLLNG